VTEFNSDLSGNDDLQFKAVSGQLNVDEAQGIVECFVAAVGNKDSVGDIVAPGAFDGSLRRRKPRVVWGHDWNQPIGKVLAIEEVPASDPRLPAKMKAAGVGGLLARVQFNLRSERGREAFYSVAFYGEDQEWSIGYKTIKANYDPQAQANVLQEVELFEVSPVLHGANQLTATISIKGANGERVDSFDKSQWPMFDRAYAARIKADHPDIWDAGGNIKGDDQYEILSKIAEQGGKARTEDQIKALELREAWVARHKGDFLLPGVIAQVKWLAIGTRGEDHMKKTISEAISKAKTKGYGEEHDDWTDETPSYESFAPARPAPVIARRVRLVVGPNGHGRIHNGRNIHHIALDAMRSEGSSLSDDRPGIGAAISREVGKPVRLRMTEDNFVIFDVTNEDGDEDTYFMPYHFDGGQYMWGKAMEVEVEIDVHFSTEDDDENESEREWASNDDAEVKAVGAPIGGGPAGRNPDEVVDRNRNNRIFDGTPYEQAARRRTGPAGPTGADYRSPGDGYSQGNQNSRRGAANQRRQDQARRRNQRRYNSGPASSPAGNPNAVQAARSLEDVRQRGNAEEIRQTGRYLRAAARNETGRGPAGPVGPRGRRDSLDAGTQRLLDIQASGDQNQIAEVGRFLRAAERNDMTRGPMPAAGGQGLSGEVNDPANPKRQGDMTINEDGSGWVNNGGRRVRIPGYDKPAARKRALRQTSSASQKRIAQIDRQNGPAGPRPAGKSAYDPALSWDEVADLEAKGYGRTIRHLVTPNIGGKPNGRFGRDGDGDGETGEAERAAREAERASRRSLGYGQDHSPQRNPRMTPEERRQRARDLGINLPNFNDRDDRPGRGIDDAEFADQLDKISDRDRHPVQYGDDNPHIRKGPSQFIYLENGMRAYKPMNWADMSQRQRDQYVGRLMNPNKPKRKPRPADPLDPKTAEWIANYMARRKSALNGVSADNNILLSDDNLLDFLNLLTDDQIIELEEKGLLGRIGRTLGGRSGGKIGAGRGRVSRAKNPLRGRDPKDVRDLNNNGLIFDGTPFEMRAADRSEEMTYRLHNGTQIRTGMKRGDYTLPVDGAGNADGGIGEEPAQIFIRHHDGIIAKREAEIRKELDRKIGDSESAKDREISDGARRGLDSQIDELIASLEEDGKLSEARRITLVELIAKRDAWDEIEREFAKGDRSEALATQRENLWKTPITAGFRNSSDNNAALEAQVARQLREIEGDKSLANIRKAETRLRKAQQELAAMEREFMRTGGLGGKTMPGDWRKIKHNKDVEIVALKRHITNLKKGTA
jgi:HK97 family phage prohead protease